VAGSTVTDVTAPARTLCSKVDAKWSLLTIGRPLLGKRGRGRGRPAAKRVTRRMGFVRIVLQTSGALADTLIDSVQKTVLGSTF